MNHNELSYNFRYDLNDEYLKKQNIDIKSKTKLGELGFSYLDQNSKINEIITNDTETINYSFLSKKFLKFSKIQINGLYDLKKKLIRNIVLATVILTNALGINLDFNRKSYEEDSLKPQDILTLMFSFKNIGSYKSTNLAVSENDKQDIEWQNFSIENDKFEAN